MTTRISRLLAGERSTPPGLPNFDSTTVFVRATARYLRGESFPALGMIHPKLTSLIPVFGRIPTELRSTLYTWGGANEGVSPDTLEDIDVDDFRQWVVSQYPTRGYPAVVIGSSNGAAVHLASLLGIPWLPQTFLLPVRRSLGPDEIKADIDWGARHAPAFLDANTDVSLAQMHDPNQDRLMVQKLGYFRVKVQRCGDPYESFLETVLEPGGTVIILECTYDWPVIDVGERHTFQVGGLGGLDPMEYYEGSNLVSSFLADQNARQLSWDVPEPDRTVPEAEWGFDPELRADIERVADERGYDVRRLVFDDPRELSPFVASTYRDRYDRRDRHRDRLFIQSFALVEPWWTMHTGSVPYWSAFNTRPDVQYVEEYLDRTAQYDEIWATLFSHGIESAGFAPCDRWKAVLERARTDSGFIGVDTATYPHDVEMNLRYHDELPDTIHARHPHPPPLSVDRFDSIATERATDWDVEWTEL